MSIPSSRTLPGAAAALITVVFWGSAFAGIRAGLHSYSPDAPRPAAVPCRLRGAAPSSSSDRECGARRFATFRRIVLLGLLGFAFYNIALNIGEQSIPAGPAALLIQTLPIWTALAAIVFLGERLRPWGWIGIAVSFAGALVIALGKGSGFTLSWGGGPDPPRLGLGQRLQHHPEDDAGPLPARWRSRRGPSGRGRCCCCRFPAVWSARCAPPRSPTLSRWSTSGSGRRRLPMSPGRSCFHACPHRARPASCSSCPWSRSSSAGSGCGKPRRCIDLAGGILAMGGVALVNTLGRAKKSSTGRTPGSPHRRSARKKSPRHCRGLALRAAFSYQTFSSDSRPRQVPHEDDRR